MRPIISLPTGPRRPAVELVVLNTVPLEDIAGLHEIPGRLPKVLRLPGEPFEAMVRRALREVTGSGVVLALPIIERGSGA